MQNCQHRKPVQDVLQPARVVSSSGLRGIVSFSLRISDKSTITQEIIMDAMCPYIKFNTEVHNGMKKKFKMWTVSEWTTLHPLISGDVGGVSQVPQGGIPSASAQPQRHV